MSEYLTIEELSYAFIIGVEFGFFCAVIREIILDIKGI